MDGANGPEHELRDRLTLNGYQDALHTYSPGFAACHALGLSGELAEVQAEVEVLRAAGRVADAVKKEVFHGRTPDREALLKELGDVLFYISGVAKDHGITLEEVGRANIEKLRKRYPNGFERGGGIR